MRKIIIFNLLFCIINFNTIGQVVNREIPPSFYKLTNGRAKENIFTKFISPPNKESALTVNEEKRTDSIEREYVVGKSIEIDCDILKLGTLDVLENGDKIWRLHIVTSGAKELLLYFDKFYLSENSQLFVYSSDQKQLLRTFTAADNRESKKIALGPIIGEELSIEYFEPHSIANKSELNLSEIGYIYGDTDGLILKSFGDAPSCHVNVNCPEGSGWCNQKRSVAKIYIRNAMGNIAVATGSLVTNEKRDLRPFFITAGHCVDQDDNNSFSQQEISDVQYWIFAFNYESQTCTNPTVEPIDNRVYGARWVSGNMNMDFALLELYQRPPGNFNTYYNGWSNKATEWGSGVVIHHPKGDVKKITFWEKIWQPSTYFNSYIPNKGGVEGGSSGAPVYNTDGLLVGVHSSSAALSPCTNIGLRFYGQFAEMWNDGSNQSLRVKEFLNPSGAIVSITGDDPCRVSYSFIGIGV